MTELTREEEAQAIAAAKDDPRGFGSLYEAHFSRIFRYLLARLRDADRAEDLAQQTFLEALRSLRRYRDSGAPYAAYLYRIAHNLLVNSFRERPASEIADAERIPAATKEDAEVALIWKEVERLPIDVQDAIALRFREGLTIPAIAAILGTSESATKMTLSRALKTLKHTINPAAGNDL